MCAQYCISFADVEKAHTNIRDCIHLTPVLTSSILNQVTGRNLYFKCELFQKTGSFKVRGALNAIRGLIPATSEKPKAVVTHSSGNHGQALAYAAKLEGIPAYIVVPQTAPNCKKLGIQAYGASIVFSEQSDEAREKVTKQIMEETEGIMVHPNQEPAVIAGQGTIAMEVLNQVPLVDALVVPVGGGGMVAGIAITVKALRPSVKVYAAEPLNADDCYQSKLKGELTPNPYPPETIADGVKSSIGLNTWPIIRDLVDDVFTVREDEIKYATQLVWERMKLLIEPTAGVGVAAVLSQHFQTISPEVKNICIVLSGGNVDLTSVTWMKQAERPAPYQSVFV
ncbi:serine racemase [Desmodus rotundus]|uniref:serine racemase n=1 Tax=Desmodus rotundus TaxID=9430 RepID=UPI000D1843FA|nr:serine racemase [Desmodus rotundus]XP_024420531.1 serine racemase [Desmodus rotundus]XP_024420533.1 serine racemase [Desmodus rotundus]XP_024420534.1 serine racemase [Desmodus rotundus]XP_024420535.1 serine racemase [Desmodus rotundus]XP_045054950.1 serine racemase [Desmodus rotundus]XP_045054951.1 serine racemase [Desmodus rotundus]XP_045054953.1 serine racemase [Desmodus rotundus]XP_053767084.1 serine racemase [Desmodus rotundus]XP_053767085.1 serine racemase [Desmodus rotundus]XP_05